MKKNIAILILFIFATHFSWSSENACQIVDITGKILYINSCQNIENLINSNEGLPSNGIYFLKNKNHFQKIKRKNNKTAFSKSFYSDSISTTENRTSFSKAMRKEASLSNNYYFRTNFFAINGIGYNSYLKAQNNFASLFSYIKKDIQVLFPQDTISTKLIFNKTSFNIYTDLIQSILLKAEELEIKEKFLTDIGSLLFLPSLYIMDELLNWISDGEYENKVKEFTEYRDKIIMETIPIIGENTATKSKLRNALAESANNKSRAIVLGHSQGGMYTYEAFNTFPDLVRTHFYSLNIAVPTDKNPNWFLGNEKDWVLNTFRIPLINPIPEGEPNSSDDGGDYAGKSGHYHEWDSSYYNPHLLSYAKINDAITNAFRTVPYWEKIFNTVTYQLLWYYSAAESTIEIAKADGSWVTLGTYSGYDVIDPSTKTVSNILLQDGYPVLRVQSYYDYRWWGPSLSTDYYSPFTIKSIDGNVLTYLASDAYSVGTNDDASFTLTLVIQ